MTIGASAHMSDADYYCVCGEYCKELKNRWRSAGLRGSTSISSSDAESEEEDHAAPSKV